MKLAVKALKLVLVAHGVTPPGLVSRGEFSVLQVQAVRKESKAETETGGRLDPSGPQSPQQAPVSAPPAVQDHRQPSLWNRAKGAGVGGLFTWVKNKVFPGTPRQTVQGDQDSRALVAVGHEATSAAAVQDLSEDPDWTCLPITPLPETRLRRPDWRCVNELGVYFDVGSLNGLKVDVALVKREKGFIEKPFLDFVRNTVVPAFAVVAGYAAAAKVVVPAISFSSHAIAGSAVAASVADHLASVAHTVLDLAAKTVTAVVRNAAMALGVKSAQGHLDESRPRSLDGCPQTTEYRKRIAVYKDDTPVYVIEADNDKMSQGRIGFFIFGLPETASGEQLDGVIVDHMHVLTPCEKKNLHDGKERNAGDCRLPPFMVPAWYAVKGFKGAEFAMMSREVWSLYEITTREVVHAPTHGAEYDEGYAILTSQTNQSKKKIEQEIAATPSYILEGRTDGALVRFVSPRTPADQGTEEENLPGRPYANLLVDAGLHDAEIRDRVSTQQEQVEKSIRLDDLSTDDNIVAVIQGRDYKGVSPRQKAGEPDGAAPQVPAPEQTNNPGLVVRTKVQDKETGRSFEIEKATLEKHTMASLFLATVWDRTNRRKWLPWIRKFFQKVVARMEALPKNYKHKCARDNEKTLGLRKQKAVPAGAPAAQAVLEELAKGAHGETETPANKAANPFVSAAWPLGPALGAGQADLRATDGGPKRRKPTSPTAKRSRPPAPGRQWMRADKPPGLASSFIVESDGDMIAETRNLETSTPPGLPEGDTTEKLAAGDDGGEGRTIAGVELLPRDVEKPPDFLERGANQQAEEEKDLVGANDVNKNRFGDPPDASAPPPAPAAPPPVVVPSRPRSFLQRRTTAPVVVPPTEPVVVVPSPSPSFLQRRTLEPDEKNNPAGDENKLAGDDRADRAGQAAKTHPAGEGKKPAGDGDDGIDFILIALFLFLFFFFLCPRLLQIAMRVIVSCRCPCQQLKIIY
ncbi:unnamed protein product [Amoebophrya sp. A120]|nr:unnamed protein product [Amoebophrya sp. A120]|eukprot:GSA120T00022920001.1